MWAVCLMFWGGRLLLDLSWLSGWAIGNKGGLGYEVTSYELYCIALYWYYSEGT